MIAVADQIGLSAVSQVAKDVRDCALSDDAVALGSTVARLTRVTDRSLTEIWDVSVMP
ncbi:hypothetical protein [Aestuariibius sp. HNIBRBA575]|uniref:hypothetical protein n=1 Tax=Aestuariibius sp. HNIBRBA575 TaxID=3233343 RepID=UPI0034A142FC